MIAIVDADIPIFQVSVVHETQWDDEPDEQLRDNICKAVRDRIEEWVSWLSPDKVVCAFSGRDNFRKDIYPAYKAHRDPDYGPTFKHEIREFLGGLYQTVEMDHYEADDVLAIYGTDPDLQDQVVLVSEDKDMLQVPGRFFQIRRKTEPEMHNITPEQSEHNLLVQWLMGDSADNLKGAFRIGPKKAEAYVASLRGSYEKKREACLSQFLSTGVSEAQAIAEYNCIRLVRWGEEGLFGPTNLWRMNDL